MGVGIGGGGGFRARGWHHPFSPTLGLPVTVSIAISPPGCLTHLGTIGELVCRQIDLAKAALADEPPKSIAANRLQVGRREFTAQCGSVSWGRCGEADDLTQEAACTSLRAVPAVSTECKWRRRWLDLLPLGLQFSLSPEIRLHGLRRSEVSSGEAS